jgi:hypothetical protein
MANTKFSELTLLTAANAVAADFLYINDDSASEATEDKRILVSELSTLILNQFETTPIAKDALMYTGSTWDSRPIVEADISDLGTYAGLVANSFTGKQTITLTTSQQKWAYDVSNDLELSVDSAGNATFTATGDINFMGGNVGIGTTNPGAELEIQNSSDGSDAVNVSNASGGRIFGVNSDPTGDGEVRIRNSSDSVKILLSADTSTASYFKGGNVGIGLDPTSNMEGLSIEQGLLTLKERATPTADTNYGKIYTKTDNKIYFQDGAGVEHEIAFV